MGKRILVFAGGTLLMPSAIPFRDENTYIICANGGFRNAREHGIFPDLVIGDLDSMSSDDKEYLREHHISVERHPVEKNASDLELALDRAVSLGPDSVTILGALGDRLDHSLINIMLLGKYFHEHFPIKIVHGDEEIFLAHNGELISEPVGTLLSLVPLTGEVTEVTLEGFKYPLDSESLFMGTTRGLSNILLHPPGVIRYASGFLLVILSKLPMMEEIYESV